jgi:hypothetical protein
MENTQKYIEPEEIDMDNFAEYLVKREMNTADKFKRAMIYVGGTIITLALAVFSFFNMGTILSMVGLILAAAAGYGTYFLGQNTYVEYEYTFTNGELDIDKIIGKKKRQSLVTADVHKFTAFGKYTDDIPETEDMTIVISSDNIAKHEYYADFEHEEYGSTRIVFSPNDNMLANIKRSLPTKLRNSIDIM